MPHSRVSQSGMLSRSPGATNLPSRPMMRPAMRTPMISTMDLPLGIGDGSRLLYPAQPTAVTGAAPDIRSSLVFRPVTASVVGVGTGLNRTRGPRAGCGLHRLRRDQPLVAQRQYG